MTAVASADKPDESAVDWLIDKILSFGVDGVGPAMGAVEIAEEHRKQHVDVETAIDRLIGTHFRLAGASGFVLGLPGPLAAPVSIRADVTCFTFLPRVALLELPIYEGMTSIPMRSAVWSFCHS